MGILLANPNRQVIVFTGDGEFTAVAAQVPIQIAEYAYEAAVKYLEGETDPSEKKVYLDSHLVLEDEAKETVNDWQ